MPETVSDAIEVLFACPVVRLRTELTLDRPLVLAEIDHASLATTLAGAFKKGLKRSACAASQCGSVLCAVEADGRVRCESPATCELPWLYRPYDGYQLLPCVTVAPLNRFSGTDVLSIDLVLRGKRAVAMRTVVKQALEHAGRLGLNDIRGKVSFETKSMAVAPAQCSRDMAAKSRPFGGGCFRLEFVSPFQPPVKDQDVPFSQERLVRWIAQAAYNGARFALADLKLPGEPSDHHVLALAVKASASEKLPRGIRVLSCDIDEAPIGQRRSGSNGACFPLGGWRGTIDLSATAETLPWLANFVLFGGTRQSLGQSRLRLWADLE